MTVLLLPFIASISFILLECDVGVHARPRGFLFLVLESHAIACSCPTCFSIQFLIFTKQNIATRAAPRSRIGAPSADSAPRGYARIDSCMFCFQRTSSDQQKQVGHTCQCSSAQYDESPEPFRRSPRLQQHARRHRVAHQIIK